MKKMKQAFLFFAIFVSVCALFASAEAATIELNNIDDDGVGFNDPTPASPVGGNTGTTVGAQRLQVFERAAEIWENALDSNVTIVVQSTFQDRGFTPCTPTSGAIGAATSLQIFANTPGLHWPNTWHKVALANKLANADQAPGPPDSGFLAEPFADDIIAFFNPNVGTAACLTTRVWYYGLDHNEGASGIDLLAVVLHEIGHGLGFANDVTEASGASPLGLPDVYSSFTYDNVVDKAWNQMHNAERAASAVRFRKVVFAGPEVTAEAPNVLTLGDVDLFITAPSSLSGTILLFGTAAFGPPATQANFSGNVVLGVDGVVGAGSPPGTVNDGCEPLTNGGAISGNIALVERGFCAFTVKVKNAQNAGATGVLVQNNAGGAFGMAGVDPTITIPSLGISTADGNLIRSNSGVAVALQSFPNRMVGADDDGRVMIFTPNPVQGGSSGSHWDQKPQPNLLMEPAINADLTDNLDLTDELLFDTSWDGDLHCPVTSDDRATVFLANGCNSGVANDLGPFVVFPELNNKKIAGPVAGGCYLADTLKYCSPRTGGDYASCVSQVTTALLNSGAINGSEKGAIQDCLDE